MFINKEVFSMIDEFDNKFFSNLVKNEISSVMISAS